MVLLIPDGVSVMVGKMTLNWPFDINFKVQGALNLLLKTKDIYLVHNFMRTGIIIIYKLKLILKI